MMSMFDLVDETSAKIAKANAQRRRICGDEVDGSMNKWNGRPYSQGYYEIFEKRDCLARVSGSHEAQSNLGSDTSVCFVRC